MPALAACFGFGSLGETSSKSADFSDETMEQAKAQWTTLSNAFASDQRTDLGPAWDEELRSLYTEVHNEDLYRSKGLSGLLGDSLLDYEPLKKKIAEVAQSVITAAELLK